MSKKFGQLIFEWRSLVAAFGLMSRIPLYRLAAGAINTEHHHRAQIWYPAVGLALGAVISMVASLAPAHWYDFLTATAVIILWVALTGALHIDGLADTADAWVGGMGDRKRTLEIMKDPSSGPMGVSVVVLCLLLKCALLMQLIAQNHAIYLLAVPMLARAWLLPLLATLPYARAIDGSEKTGMADSIATHFPKTAGLTSFGIAQLLTFFLILLQGGGLGSCLVLLLVSAAIGYVIHRKASARLQGYTGDVLGASIELQELGLLLSFVLISAA